MFKIYDLTSFKNKPDWFTNNSKVAGITYPQFFYEDKTKIKIELPGKDYYKDYIRRKTANKDWDFLVIDHEVWINDAKDLENDELRNKAIRDLSMFLKWAREANHTKIKYGLYTIPPIRNYWGALKNDYRWHQQNDYLKELAIYCDIIFPSLYTFYDDKEGWVEYATKNIDQARQYMKPVIPFLWPRYHSSNSELGMNFIDHDFWLTQLLTCYHNSDGIVIWDPKKDEFPTMDSGFYTATKEFMEINS